MNYIPHPWHFFFPSLAFAAGVLCFTSPVTETLGWLLIALGIVITWVIGRAMIWDAFVRKATSMQYLFDSARHLDSDMVDRLLYAMGLRVEPKPAQPTTTNLTVTKVDSSGGVTQQQNYKEIPASPDQLSKLSKVIIEDGAPFSRAEMIRLGIFTDAGFRTFKSWAWEKQLLELINPSNINNGYRFNNDGIDFLESHLPHSPTVINSQPEMA